MYKFEDIFNFEKLLEAHYRARKSKRHKKEIINFEIHLFYNLSLLEQQLQNGKYVLRRYKKFKIYEPKEREIQALTYYDRVVQNCLCYNFLLPFYSKKFIFDNAACQKGKGTHFARNRLQHFLLDFYKHNGTNGYVLKIDVKKYFNSIDHDILKNTLGDIYDPKIKNLIFHIIDSYNHTPNKGLPMGNQSSQIFALLYLNKIDRIIKEKYQIKHYVRYMDDLIIIDQDKYKLIRLLEELKSTANELKIQFNNKTEITPLKSGIEFLGVRFSYLKSGKLLKRLKQQSKRRMIKKVKKIKLDYNHKIIAKSDIQKSLAGFNGNLKYLSVEGIIKDYLLTLKHYMAYKAVKKPKNTPLHGATA